MVYVFIVTQQTIKLTNFSQTVESIYGWLGNIFVTSTGSRVQSSTLYVIETVAITCGCRPWVCISVGEREAVCFTLSCNVYVKAGKRLLWEARVTPPVSDMGWSTDVTKTGRSYTGRGGWERAVGLSLTPTGLAAGRGSRRLVSRAGPRGDRRLHEEGAVGGDRRSRTKPVVSTQDEEEWGKGTHLFSMTQHFRSLTVAKPLGDETPRLHIPHINLTLSSQLGCSVRLCVFSVFYLIK